MSLKRAQSLDEGSFSFFTARFNRLKRVEVRGGVGPGTLVIKQKRSKTVTRVPLVFTSQAAELGGPDSARRHLSALQPGLYTSNLLRSLEQHPVNLYKGFKVSNSKSESVSAHLARRLQRTQRTLILPAQVNMTLVTNSYDVIHSWFLPSLGVKMDCVPGRSTHHSFYVDSFGFIYGQCAEICGRYHHHMPIRLCMLPFEHFLVWWHHFGLPRVLNLRPSSSEEEPLTIARFT